MTVTEKKPGLSQAETLRRGLEALAHDILCCYNDQGFSYTETLSFVLIEQREFTEALPLDHHFLLAGITQLPAEQ